MLNPFPENVLNNYCLSAVAMLETILPLQQSRDSTHVLPQAKYNSLNFKGCVAAGMKK